MKSVSTHQIFTFPIIGFATSARFKASKLKNPKQKLWNLQISKLSLVKAPRFRIPQISRFDNSNFPNCRNAPFPTCSTSNISKYPEHMLNYVGFVRVCFEILQHNLRGDICKYPKMFEMQLISRILC